MRHSSRLKRLKCEPAETVGRVLWQRQEVCYGNVTFGFELVAYRALCPFVPEG